MMFGPHNLSSIGFLFSPLPVCEECYSLISDKSVQLSSMTSHIQDMMSQAIRAQEQITHSASSRDSNLTFSQSVERITTQVNLLTTEV